MDIVLEPLRVIMEHTAVVHKIALNVYIYAIQSLKYEDMPNYSLIAEQLRIIMEVVPL